jgi:hypothetical protein
LAIGQILLIKHNHPDGVAHLERAAASNPMHLRAGAFYMIASYYARNAQHDHADAWLVKAEQASDQSVDANRERNAITKRNRFKPSRLDPQSMAALEAAVMQSAAGAQIKRIWIVEKQVQQFPEVPVHVVLFKPNFFSRGKDKIAAKLAQELGQNPAFKGDWFFLPDVRVRRPVAKKIKAVATRVGFP